MRFGAVRAPVVWALLGVLALLVAACGGVSRTSTQAAAGSLAADVDLRDQTYVVGGKDNVEQRLLCEIMVAALESTGAGVTDRCAGGYDARAALLTGEINVYWEDTGTAWATFLRGEGRPPAGEMYREVAERDLAANGVVWLNRAGFDGTRVLTVAGQEAARLRLRTVSDMAGYLRSGQPGTMCVDGVYATRGDGLAALEKAYGLTIRPEQVQVLDAGLVPQSTADGVCMFGEVGTTDGRTAGLGLTVLDDDKRAHVAANIAPTVRKDAFDQNPGIARVLDPISAALNLPTMVELNRRVTTESVSPRDAARDWLVRQGFIGSP